MKAAEGRACFQTPYHPGVWCRSRALAPALGAYADRRAPMIVIGTLNTPSIPPRMKRFAIFSALLLSMGGCRSGDSMAEIRSREVHLVSLSDVETRTAEALSKSLTSTYVAVPDTIEREGHRLRISILHAPFASWTDTVCSMTCTPRRDLIQPIAQPVWDSLAKPSGTEQLTLVARSEARAHRSRGGYLSCGGGATEHHFSPHDLSGQ
jgi:hypothetical protein